MSTPQGMPTAIRHPNPSESSVDIKQVGWEAGQIHMLHMLSHSKSGTPAFLTDMYLLPRDRTGYGDYADLAGASPSNHWTAAKTTAKISLLEFLWELHKQADTYMKSWADQAPVSMSSSGSLFTAFFADMKNSLLNKTPRMIQADGSTAATTLAQMIGGLGWMRSSTNDIYGHKQWMRRWIIALGHVWAPMMPKFNDKFENQANTQINYITYFMLCAAIYLINDLFMASLWQSEKAVANLTFLDVAYQDKKFPEKLATAINAWWYHFIKAEKNTFTPPTGYTQVDSEFVDISEITSTSTTRLVDAFQNLKLKNFNVVDIALKIARQMFGVGIYDKGGAKTNFCFLLDAANGIDTSTTPDTIAPLESATHGTTRWVLGLNTIIAYYYFDSINSYRLQNWEIAMEKRLHWSWADISSWSKTIFSSINFFDSLTGLAENASYQGFRATVFYADTTAETTAAEPIGAKTYYDNSIFSDPSKMVSTNSLAINGLATPTLQNDRPSSFWVYPFIMQSRYCDSRYSIFCYHDWTEQELIFWLRWGMMLSRITEASPLSGGYGQPTTGDQYKIWSTALMFVECVESHTKKVEGVMYVKVTKTEDA